MLKRLVTAVIGVSLLAGCSGSGDPVAAPSNPGATVTATAEPTATADATPTPTATASTPSTPHTTNRTTAPATVDITQDCADIEAAVTELSADAPTDAGAVIVAHLGGEEVPPDELAAAGQEMAAYGNRFRSILLQLANQTEHARLKQVLQQLAGVYGNLVTALSSGNYEQYHSLMISLINGGLIEELYQICDL